MSVPLQFCAGGTGVWHVGYYGAIVPLNYFARYSVVSARVGDSCPGNSVFEMYCSLRGTERYSRMRVVGTSGMAFERGDLLAKFRGMVVCGPSGRIFNYFSCCARLAVGRTACS